MSHPLYWVALQVALGIPCRNLSAIINHFGSAQQVFEATLSQLEESGVFTPGQMQRILEKPYAKAKEIYHDCQADGIDIYSPEHPLYPNSLRNMPDMPCVLYGKGTLPLLDGKPVVSIVGSRKPTLYGKIVADRMASVLAIAGGIVVSGGALGIDSVAHQGALSVGGTTIGVLGCGISARYLDANRALRKQIVQTGCLLSEYPPKEPATRFSFPLRNRIIAALSLGTVVIEAGAKSGSLITADCALEQGKDVFALPGSVMSPDFEGSNQLVSQGAIPVFSGMDVLAHYERDYYHDLNMNCARSLHAKHLQQQLVVEKREFPTYVTQNQEETAEELPQSDENSSVSHKNLHPTAGKDLSEQALRVYNIILDAKTTVLAEIIEGSNLPPHVVLRELTTLELEGLVTKGPAGQYTLC